MAYKLIFIYFCFGVVHSYNNENGYYYDNRKYCQDLSPYYGEINLDQITGVWHGVEKIPHAKGEYKIEYTRECFYIDIKEVNIEPTPPTPYLHHTNSPYVNQLYMPEQYRVRQLVLEWHEGLWQDTYHVKVNTSHKGFWPTDISDRSVDERYRFFAGVIQVLKVANNHLVLNFCMRLPHSQQYSVVLSRSEHQLLPEDLADIHHVFTQKHLSTSSLKRVCENSASAASVSAAILVSVLFLMWRPQC